MARFKGLVAGLVAAALAYSACAGTVTVVGGGTLNPGDPGNFSATFNYSYSAGVGTLTVKIKNTTASGNGFLTGFIFGKRDLGAFTDIELTSFPNASWALALDDSGSPFGTFEYGAALGGDWLGGGSPNNGLAAGEEFEFEFEFTGGAASTLTTLDFLDANGAEQFMVVRFRGGGMGGEGSDKVVGVTIIPLPPAAWMGLAGLLGVGVFRRRLVKVRG